MRHQILTPQEIVYNQALKAILLTREYVGEERLPAIPGWEWYDVGLVLSNLLTDEQSIWPELFRSKVRADQEIRAEQKRVSDYLGLKENSEDEL